MKWLYLFLFVALNYGLATQFDSLLDGAIMILMILLGLIVKIRSKKNHPRIYAFAWGMVYGNIISVFLMAGYWSWVYFS